MGDVQSDAFVLFGATGDLAYKKIFPALHSMIKRGHSTGTILGVSRGGSGLEKLRAGKHPRVRRRRGRSRIQEAFRQFTLRRWRLPDERAVHQNSRSPRRRKA